MVEADVELTPNEAFLGTPAYMSPEQHRGKTSEISAASDIWALGVILYELYTGRRPYLGDSRGELSAAVLNGPAPPTPRGLDHSLSRDLEAVINRCLAKEPAQRFATAGELGDELGRIRRGEATRTRPEGVGKRFAKVLRRRAGWVVAGVAVVLIAMLVLLPRKHLEGPTPQVDTMSFSQACQSIQKELVTGARVSLQSADGSPRAQQVREWDGKGDISARDDMLRIGQHTGMTVLELLTDPICASYEFSGEIMQEDCSSAGYVGAAVLGWERSTAQGQEHAFCALRFADSGRQLTLDAGRSPLQHLDVYYWRRIGGHSIFHTLLANDHPLNPAEPGKYHQFQFQISPKTITVIFDGKRLTQLRRDEIDAQAGKSLLFEYNPGAAAPGSVLHEQMYKSNQGLRGGFHFREVLAVFVKDSGGSFRNLTITPKSE